MVLTTFLLFAEQVITTLFLDIFMPMSWTLSSTDMPDDIPDSIEDGVYSLILTSNCHLKSPSDEHVHNVWFTIPVSYFVSCTFPSQFFLNMLLYLGPGSRYHPKNARHATLHHCAP